MNAEVAVRTPRCAIRTQPWRRRHPHADASAACGRAPRVSISRVRRSSTSRSSAAEPQQLAAGGTESRSATACSSARWCASPANSCGGVSQPATGGRSAEIARIGIAVVNSRPELGLAGDGRQRRGRSTAGGRSGGRWPQPAARGGLAPTARRKAARPARRGRRSGAQIKSTICSAPVAAAPWLAGGAGDRAGVRRQTAQVDQRAAQRARMGAYWPSAGNTAARRSTRR